MKKIITVLFSILLIIEITSLCLINQMRSFFNKDSMINKIETVDYSDISIVDDPYFGIYFENIYNFFETYYLPTSILDDFINSDVTKHFIGEISGNMIEYILNNEDKPILTDKYIDELSLELTDYTLEQLDINDIILNFDTTYFSDYLNEKLKDNISLLPTTSEISNQLDSNTLSLIQFIISDLFRTILLVALLLTILIIIIINIKKIKWIMPIMLACTFSGVILFIVTFILQNALQFISIDTHSILYILIETLFIFLINQIKKISVILIIASIGVILVYIISKNLIRTYKSDK